jgi:hypothetical protein
MVFYYGTLERRYAIRFGAHVDPLSLTDDDLVRNFPTNNPACTWTVEQSMLIRPGVLLRPSLDGASKSIGRITDLWTFALWDDGMYNFLMNETDGLYDVPCTMVTYNRADQANIYPALWGLVHVPHPLELVPLGNRYYTRPTFRFYDCEFAS